MFHCFAAFWATNAALWQEIYGESARERERERESSGKRREREGALNLGLGRFE